MRASLTRRISDVLFNNKVFSPQENVVRVSAKRSFKTSNSDGTFETRFLQEKVQRPEIFATGACRIGTCHRLTSA